MIFYENTAKGTMQSNDTKKCSRRTIPPPITTSFINPPRKLSLYNFRICSRRFNPFSMASTRLFLFPSMWSKKQVVQHKICINLKKRKVYTSLPQKNRLKGWSGSDVWHCSCWSRQESFCRTWLNSMIHFVSHVK